MTYYRLFETQNFDAKDLVSIRTTNKKDLELEDKIRCQYCQGFYWRLWYDMGQCIGCSHYSIIETEGGLTLLTIPWIKEQLTDKKGELVTSERVKDPTTGKGEFIVFQDRLRCRFTGQETLIKPKVKAYWIIKKISRIGKKIVSDEEALRIVKEGKR